MSSQQKNIILVCLLVVLGSLASVHFLLGPKYQTALTTKSGLESGLESKRKRLASINEIRVPLAKLETSMTQIESIGLPRGEQIPDLLEFVEQALYSQTDMTIVSFTPTVGKAGPGEASGGYVETPYTITVKGPSGKLSTVLDLLNTTIRPMAVKSVSITPGDDKDPPDTIQAVIAVTAYSIPDAASAPKATASAPAAGENP